MGIRGFFRDLEDDVKGELSDFDDQVRGVASDADDWRRDNPVLSAMIPFTPENQALMAGGGALLGGGMALSGALGAGAAGGGAAGAGAAGGGAAGAGAAGGATGMSLGNTLLGLGSIGAGLYGANQAKKGVKAQVEAGDRAAALEQQSADKQLALQREIWEKQQKDQAPWLKQGQQAIGRLGDLMKPNADTSAMLKNDPSYQFRLKLGQQQLDRNNAASGMGYSGSQLKAAQNYGQDLASTEFGNYYNRLAGLASGGQQTARSLGGMGSNYATGASNTLGNLSNALTGILGQQANARASGYAASANAFNQGLGNMIDIYGINRKYG